MLRAFIRYCHSRQGVRAALTAETLTAVDRCEPELQRLVRSGRALDAHALAEQLLAAGLTLDRMGYYERLVGGRAAPLALDAQPLPDEDFDWSGIPDDIRHRVAEVLTLCDRCADELFDIEHRTAIRRLLGRAAVGDPEIFRRKGAAGRAAATVCWAVANANHSIVYSGSAMTSRQMLEWFGLKGSVSQRAQVFLGAVGAQRSQTGELALGSPDFLVSRRRAQLIARRDQLLST